jgi:FkbM family methyltransferase
MADLRRGKVQSSSAAFSLADHATQQPIIPMTLRRTIHRALAPIIYGTALSVIPGRVASLWPERHFLKHFLKRLNVDCVLDIGANVGQFAEDLRLIGYKGLIASVEPNPDAFATLAAKARNDPRWEAHNLALGSAQGRATLNVMSVSVYSSLKAPSTRESASHADLNAVVKTVEVELSTLEMFYRQLKAKHGFRRPFLKLDTQGSDIDVFKGGAAINDDFAGVVSELSIRRIYDDTPSWSESLAVFQDGGFQVAGLFPVGDDEIHLPIEFNCYMVHGVA